MSEFWSVAAFLAIAVLALGLALAFVLPFLLRKKTDRQDAVARREMNLAVYRDQMKDLKAELSAAQISQEQFLATKLELETRAAEDALAPDDAATAPMASRRLGFTLAAVLPVAAFGLYFWLGNPAVLTAIAGGQGAQPVATAPTPEDIMGMIQQIEARTQTHPSDGAAWEALAMANALLARWTEAARAYQEAYRLLPEKPSVMVGYAESLAMAGNQVLAGRPIQLINRALQADPGHMKGLELAGIHAFQTQNFAQAVEFLDRLGRQLPPDTPYAREVLEMRNDAERRAQAGVGGAMAGAPSAPSADGPRGATESDAGVTGRVEVADALRPRIGQQYTVFVLARAGEGGPPLAAMRVPMGSLPMPFNLNDSMAMIPGNVLSGHKEVVLVARISASGNPIAQPGDLEGRLTGVPVGSTGVSLVIDRVLP
jgi:cytochrome c-type biogenesis protein CcmH